jgi:malic enzyme
VDAKRPDRATIFYSTTCTSRALHQQLAPDRGGSGVTLAGLINALKITGGRLDEQRILFLGAGSAAIGLADLNVSAQVQQGVAPGAARQRIRMFDT